MEYVLILSGAVFLAIYSLLPKKSIQITFLVLGLFLTGFGVYISWQNNLIAQKYTYIKSIGLLGGNYLGSTNLIVGGFPIIEENMKAVMVQDPTAKRYKPNCDMDVAPYMQKIIEQYPEYPFSYVVMAWCVEEQERYEYEYESIKHLSAIMSLPNHTPDHEEVWRGISDDLTWKGSLLRHFPFLPINIMMKI